MIKIMKHEVPLYFGTFNIVITDVFQQALDKLKFKFDGFDPDKYGAFAHDCFDKEGYANYYIFIKPDVSEKLVAHEAVHISNYIFRDKGIELDLNNDEPYAYLIGWIVGIIHKELNKIK